MGGTGRGQVVLKPVQGRGFPDLGPSQPSSQVRVGHPGEGPHLFSFVLYARQKYGGAQEEAYAEVQVHGGARALDGPH